MSGYLDIHEYPSAAAIAGLLVTNWQRIARDAARMREVGLFDPWHEPLHGGGWLAAGLKWQGEMLPDWERHFAGALAAVCPAIVNCGYSLLLPGTEIVPHEGYTSDVVRLHIGLRVPDGDCALVVGGEARRWYAGGYLFFDDTIEHSAHNRTDGERMVLLLDLDRVAISAPVTTSAAGSATPAASPR